LPQELTVLATVVRTLRFRMLGIRLMEEVFAVEEPSAANHN